ncbi:hypothetical protein K402DRAFT_389809 [Aulographum hederae CBS 113979]|uniref:Uncharacterized protein n=1 Tax=Aulographum hederae CBS 113979 TaxID=1176131 RepID=A0A6G1HCF3_9PEZI|nr:hypothetical protein K402DRAFT_389809 [Aulographum hederae CBS 113979]
MTAASLSVLSASVQRPSASASSSSIVTVHQTTLRRWKIAETKQRSPPVQRQQAKRIVSPQSGETRAPAGRARSANVAPKLATLDPKRPTLV